MNQSAQEISPDALVPMDLFRNNFPLRVQLAYKHDTSPNIFGSIYAQSARLWLHVDLAKIVLLAAHFIHEQSGFECVLYDGLRTIEAQKRMANSPIARANPHWLEQPNRLLSPPGGGAHPRGMAIDLSILGSDGAPLDMGTAFDYLAEDASAEHNPAHRDHPNISTEAQSNRALLTDAMVKAAAMLSTPLMPLPQEWWDFRLPTKTYERYAPLSDADLPPDMRMTQDGGSNDSPNSRPENLSVKHFESLKASLMDDLNLHLR